MEASYGLGLLSTAVLSTFGRSDVVGALSTATGQIAIPIVVDVKGAGATTTRHGEAEPMSRCSQESKCIAQSPDVEKVVGRIVDRMPDDPSWIDIAVIQDHDRRPGVGR